jgi:cell division protein FtsB
MLEKIQNLQKSPYVQQLRDIRSVGLLVFCVVVLLVSWSGVKVIQSNYDLQKQISRLEQRSDVQELGNINLKLKNEYLNTDQYLELSARRQFGKGAPGEKLIVVPKTVAVAHAAPVVSDKVANAKAANQSVSQKNFQAWMNFFLHRPQFID